MPKKYTRKNTKARYGGMRGLITSIGKQIAIGVAKNAIYQGSKKMWGGKKGKYHKKKSYAIVRPPASGLSNSTTKLWYKKTKVGREALKLFEPATYENDFTISVSNTAYNTQAIARMHVGYSSSGSTTISNLFTKVQQGYSGGTGVLPLYGNSSVQNSFKFEVNSMVQILTLSNESPGAVEFDIYDCVAKVTSTTYLAPEDAWTNGLVDENNAGVACANTFIGATPFTSKLFNSTWKVVKRSKVELGSGRAHRHVFNFKPNRVVDSQYFDNFACVKGITTTTFVVARGMPVDSSNTATIGTIGVSPVKLVGYVREKYVTRLVSVAPRTYYQSTNITTDALTRYTVQEGSGAPVDVKASATTYG